MTTKIAGTFTSLVKISDFSASVEVKPELNGLPLQERDEQKPSLPKLIAASPLRPEFHYNLQIHLPANATEENYLAIFTALRKSFAT